MTHSLSLFKIDTDLRVPFPTPLFAQIFDDDFESGDTGEWSSTVQ